MSQESFPQHIDPPESEAAAAPPAHAAESETPAEAEAEESRNPEIPEALRALDVREQGIESAASDRGSERGRSLAHAMRRVTAGVMLLMASAGFAEACGQAQHDDEMERYRATRAQAGQRMDEIKAAHERALPAGYSFGAPKIQLRCPQERVGVYRDGTWIRDITPARVMLSEDDIKKGIEEIRSQTR